MMVNYGCVWVRCRHMDCNLKPSLIWLTAKWGGDRRGGEGGKFKSINISVRSKYESVLLMCQQVLTCFLLPQLEYQPQGSGEFIFLFLEMYMLVCFRYGIYAVSDAMAMDINTIYMSKAKGANAI